MVILERASLHCFAGTVVVVEDHGVQTELITERAARNQSTFRRANEAIAERAAELTVDESVVPFICECPDPGCTSVTTLSLVEYEVVRSRSEWFLAVPAMRRASSTGRRSRRLSAATTATR